MAAPLQRRPAIVGRAVTVNALPYTVIGVLPPRVKFPFLQNAWIALTPVAQSRTARESRDLEVFGRLAAGRTIDQAGDELQAIATRLAAEHPARTPAGGCAPSRSPQYYIPGDVRT